MSAPLGVGIAGAAAGGGWGGRVHVPALLALPDLRLAGVANSRPESGREAARALGIPRGFASAADLAADPDVELVAITARVTAHAEVVRAALAAGKHVFCEWPLGLDTAEAEALAAEARQAGVRTAIGLQARCAPPFLEARSLVVEGYVGTVLSVTLYSSLHGRGPVLDQRLAYTIDPANGSTNLETGGGHTLDVVRFVLQDEFHELSAILANLQPEVTVRQTGQVLASPSANHVAVAGTMRGGALVVVHNHASKRNAARTWMEISGTDGDLCLVAEGGSREPGVQGRQLTLLGAQGEGQELRPLDVRPEHRWVPDSVPGPPVLNVAQLYARFARDIREGTFEVPGFDEAVRLHHLLDVVTRASASGRREAVPAAGQSSLGVPSR